MVGSSYIDIHSLTLDELAGVVNLYPWYGAARVELCRRMARMGEDWGEAQYAAEALYIPDRGKLALLVRRARTVDCSDKDVHQLMQAFMPEQPTLQPTRKVYVVGGDYFSQDQYADVKSDGDGIFSKFAAKAREEGYAEEVEAEPGKEGFCTETLAGIYLEQGYPQEAIDIYSRLSLRYPEKSVYFAALIDEINKKDN